ncbi:ammonium transporter [Nocardioides nematodiphilus]|uniref:ammonium transporter n=1 Tax=Nocardioides nematodiphilus TaxID=2849669 RepID=UPI001CD9225B|nr:ammonium transporter [Nocardioides nematodiphilus]MCA1982057.1 ammonium transporter [Nocardioides nematodiphilus]
MFSLLSVPALEVPIDAGDTAWLLAAAALVMLMVPGLALFYGGMVRSKSVLNMMMMTFAALGVITLVWVLVGYSLAFGDDVAAGVLGSPREYFGLQSLVSGEHNWMSVPTILFACFQGLFAVITGGLIAGAIADRARFGAWMVFCAFWTVLVYAPVAHWVFDASRTGHVGGWLINKVHVIDFAGGTAVEICSGASGLALALILGRRVGFGHDAMRPHNLTLVMLGAGLLWVGWFGFNAGSAFGADQNAAVVFAATLVAGAAGAGSWLVVERLRDGHATSLGAASGMVAGLVAITPSCGSVTPLGAIVVGLVAGAVCAWAIALKYRYKYDDSLDVVGVHLVGGMVGTILVGVLGSAGAPTGVDGLLYGGGMTQLGRQSVGALVVLVYSFVASGVLGLVIHKAMGFRIDPDHEVQGIDLVVHAETAYDLHTTGGTRAGSIFGHHS